MGSLKRKLPFVKINSILGVDLNFLTILHLPPPVASIAESLLKGPRWFCIAFPLAEVTLKVHISDASTHQPVPDARIEIFTNQVSIASGTSGTDGVVFIKFRYKLGSQLIVTATKHAYVPNSAPWKPIRLPGKMLLTYL